MKPAPPVAWILREVAVAGVHHRSVLVAGEPPMGVLGDHRADLVVAGPGLDRDPDGVGVCRVELDQELRAEGQDAQAAGVL